MVVIMCDFRQGMMRFLAPGHAPSGAASAPTRGPGRSGGRASSIFGTCGLPFELRRSLHAAEGRADADAHSAWAKRSTSATGARATGGPPRRGLCRASISIGRGARTLDQLRERAAHSTVPPQSHFDARVYIRPQAANKTSRECAQRDPFQSAGKTGFSAGDIMERVALPATSPSRPRPRFSAASNAASASGSSSVGQHRRVQQLHDAIDHDLEHHGAPREAVDEAFRLSSR